MRNLLLFGTVVAACLVALGGGNTAASYTPETCVDATYYNLEDLGPLHPPGVPAHPAPVGPFPLPEPWMQRCRSPAVGGMNQSGDVVFTKNTLQGTEVQVAAAGGLRSVPDPSAVACHVGEDRFISGRNGSGMALWYPSGTSYLPYPYQVAPPWALPSLGVLAGTSPSPLLRVGSSGILQVVPAGSYLDSWGIDSLLGNWIPSLGQPTGRSLFLNGATERPEGVFAFGSDVDAGWRPFHVFADPTSGQIVHHPLPAVGSVHAMNERGAYVGCARFDGLEEVVSPFAMGARYQGTPHEGLVALDEEFSDWLDRVLEPWACLYDLNRHDIAGGTIGGTWGFLWSSISGFTHLGASPFPFPPYVTPTTPDGRSIQLAEIRGILDDGTLAGTAWLRDDQDNSELRAVRLHPNVRLDRIEIVNDGVDPATGLPIVRGSGVQVRVYLVTPLPQFCHPRTWSSTLYWGSATLEGRNFVSLPTEDPSPTVGGWITIGNHPVQRTVGIEVAGQRRETQILHVPSSEALCKDGIDNDLDGDVDCLDDDCDLRECRTGEGLDGRCVNRQCVPYEWICSDGLDDDGDGLVDCEDPDCDRRECGPYKYCYRGVCSGPLFETSCRPWDPPGTCPNACSNGADDDEDELTDCEDPDCEGLRCHLEGSICIEGRCVEVICDDGIDNDGNEGADCADSDCEGQPCGPGSICLDRECSEIICDDGIDNDGNEKTDCEDPSCDGRPCADGAICLEGRCTEVNCMDGNDNNSNTFTDCDDDDCDRRECGIGGAVCLGKRCVERNCWDGLDNDGDWLVDCDDWDCNGRLCFDDKTGEFGTCWERRCIPCESCSDKRCADAPCGPGMRCENEKCRPFEDECSNGLDDDGDQLIDCLDDDCDGRDCLTPKGAWGICVNRVCA